MAWWKTEAPAQTRASKSASAQPLSVQIAADVLRRTEAHGPATAAAALSVPAFGSAARLVTHQAATLPLAVWQAGVRQDTPPMLRQPELGRSRWVTMQRTYLDLALHGWACWVVRRTDWDGYPSRVEHLPAAELQRREASIVHKGNEIGCERVIIFEGFSAGLLTTGAATIAKARALHRLAARRARSAQPVTVFTPRDGAPDPTDDEIDGFIADWEENPESPLRFTSASVQAERIGWNSRELQLVDALQASEAECARLWSIDPAWVGVGVAGASLTYSNRQDLRAQLVDGPIRMLTQTVEQRLSMTRDEVDPARHGVGVTPARDRVVRVDFSGYLRPDLETRISVATTALAGGIWTTQEARDYANEYFD